MSKTVEELEAAIAAARVEAKRAIKARAYAQERAIKARAYAQEQIRPALLAEERATRGLRLLEDELQRARYSKEPVEEILLEEIDPEPIRAVIWHGPEDDARVKGWFKENYVDVGIKTNRANATYIYDYAHDEHTRLKPGCYIVINGSNKMCSAEIFLTADALRTEYKIKEK